MPPRVHASVRLGEEYPREGEAIVPSRLAWLFGASVPDWLLDLSSDYECLADLDASVWRVIDSADASRLAGHAKDCLSQQAALLLDQLATEPLWLGSSLPSTPLTASPWTAQVLGVLDASDSKGWPYATLQEFLDAADGDVAALLDTLCALEQWGFGSDELWIRTSSLSSIARSVEQSLSNADVGKSDPRLGDAIRALTGVAPFHLRHARVDVLASWVADHPHKAVHCHGVEAAFDALWCSIQQVQKESLHDQISATVTASVRHQRDARILIRRYGLDGQTAPTLQEIADEEGLTRERIRQICVRAERALTELSGTPFVPALDAALRLLESSAPISARQATDLLKQTGIEESPTASFRSLLDVARVLQRTTLLKSSFVGPVEWIHTDDEGLPSKSELTAVRGRAGRLTDARGASNVEALRLALEQQDGLQLDADSVLEALQDHPGFEWLDETSGWFWITNRNPNRNRFFNLLRKVLSVSGSLGVDEVRSSLRRSRRLKGPFPPADVLVRMCSRYPGFRCDGGSVYLDPPLEFRSVLQGTELYVVELLTQMGNVARVEDMWRLASQDGIGRVSFWVTLAGSPAIVRHARSTYGLRGAKVPASELWDVANRRMLRENSVLRDWGHTAKGQPWLLFKLSENSVQVGQMALPQPLKGAIDGHYVLRFQQSDIAGTATIQGAMITGLRKVFRSAQAESGDWMLVGVDADDKVLHFLFGDEELSLTDDEDVATLIGAARRDPQEDASHEQLQLGCDEPELQVAQGGGDSPLAPLVLGVLARAYRPLKAREIAKAIETMHGTEVERGDVNHLLYGVLSERVKDIGQGVWVLCDDSDRSFRAHFSRQIDAWTTPA